MNDPVRPPRPDNAARFPVGTLEKQRSAILLATRLGCFLDATAAATPDPRLIASLVADLARWTDRLEGIAGSEQESLWRMGPRDHPPALAPALSFEEADAGLVGTVTFRRFHIGRGAAHGGAIALVFDEIMGALAATGDRPLSRTVFLHVDYRALTPLDRPRTLLARFEREQAASDFSARR